MSRRGICLIWFRGRHISPSMPYREARSKAESSEGPTASKSDRTGRNPGMTRLVRRSSAMSGGTAFFPLVQRFRLRMRKCSGSPIPSLPKKLRCCFFFLQGIDISNYLSSYILKDGAYYCYCAYVLRISRYSDFLSVMHTNTGIFLRGLKLCRECRS